MKRSKKISDEFWIVVLLIAVIVVFYGGYAGSPDETRPETAKKADIPVDGYEKVSIAMQMNDLVFSSQCYQLGMTVADTQALSISYGIENTTYERPLTHDMMKDIFENYGISVLLTKIDSYTNGIYYAKIFLQQGRKVLELDARPSDAAGIAVRAGASMYFKKDLLEQYGTYTC